MIDKVLENKLISNLNFINVKYNKGGELAVNEWDFSDDVEVQIQNNFNLYTINIIAILEATKIGVITKNNKFLNRLKQDFAITRIDFRRIENNRYQLNLSLVQAVCGEG